MQSAGCRVRVQGSGLRVQGSGFRVQVSGFRVQGSGFRVQGSGVRVQGSGSGLGSSETCRPGPPNACGSGEEDIARGDMSPSETCLRVMSPREDMSARAAGNSGVFTGRRIGSEIEELRRCPPLGGGEPPALRGGPNQGLESEPFLGWQRRISFSAGKGESASLPSKWLKSRPDD